MKKQKPRITRKWFFVLILFFQSYALTAQMQPIGLFDHHEDVGNPILKGSAIYNKEDQTYTLSSAGKNMWTNADQFQFAWKKNKRGFHYQSHYSVYW